jgi:hypothetical protein
MAKYDPLRHHLSRQKLSEIILSFEEIGSILGEPLPESASLPQFWENASKEHHQRGANKAAREAGYKTYLIDGRNVRFRRET